LQFQYKNSIQNESRIYQILRESDLINTFAITVRAKQLSSFLQICEKQSFQQGNWKLVSTKILQT